LIRRLLVAALVALPLPSVAAEEPVPLATLEGTPVALARREGEPALIVHFWATWCPSCVEELPFLAEAAKACAASGVRIVAVDVGERPDAIAAFLRTHGIEMPVLVDPHGRSWRRLSGIGLPTNVTWSADGRSTEVGPRDRAAWARALESLGCRARETGTAPPAR